MAGHRCCPIQRTVPVLIVVPVSEAIDPGLSILDARKSTARIAHPSLHGAEEGLDEGIVIAYARPAEGLGHAEPFQRRLQGGPLHCTPVVRVQHCLPRSEAPASLHIAKQLSRCLFAFRRVDARCHDAVTVDIRDHVEVEVAAYDVRLHVGNVPAEDLVRRGRVKLIGLSVLCHSRALAVVLHVVPTHHTVRGGLARDVRPVLCQSRNQLSWRKVSMLRAREFPEQAALLVLTELLCGTARGPRRWSSLASPPARQRSMLRTLMPTSHAHLLSLAPASCASATASRTTRRSSAPWRRPLPPHKAYSVPRRTSSTAASARALSLRASSRSNAFSRRLS
jgi:hypothetical protein